MRKINLSIIAVMFSWFYVTGFQLQATGNEYLAQGGQGIKRSQGDTLSEVKNQSNPGIRVFHGTIEYMPIRMILVKDGLKLSGYYYYTQWALPIHLTGSIDAKGNFQLTETAQGETKPSGVFEGTWNESESQPIQGKWKSTQKKSKTFDFSMARTMLYNHETNLSENLSSAELSRLEGNHYLSLQWISWDYYGNASVVKVGKMYYLFGSQHAVDRDDYVVVEGFITSIKPGEFTLQGVVSTKVGVGEEGTGGNECRREGEFNFWKSADRKYWRMQEYENPCTGYADYVDIFIRPGE